MKKLFRLMTEDKAFFPAMVRLGLPIALQCLLTSSFTLVDTLMIGSLGDVALASVGMAGKWSWVLNMVFFGLTGGAAVFIAQYWGTKDEKGIWRTFGVMSSGVTCAALVFMAVALLCPQVVVGLFTSDAQVIQSGVSYLQIACLSYLGLAVSQAASALLRSTECVRLPVIASICSVAVNALLNYVLIFGKLGLPALGVRGAAIATVVSAWVNALVIVGVGLLKKTMLRMDVRIAYRFSGVFVRHYLRVSLPVLFNESLWALGTMGYDMVFGHMGTDNFAALTIARTVQDLAFVFLIGICNACAVYVGKRIGAGEIRQAKRDALRYTVTMIGMCLLLGACVILMRAPILSLFAVSPKVRELAMLLLLIYGSEMWLRNISYIAIVGVFRAGGDTGIGVKLDLLSVWCFALPVTIVCGLFLHLPFPLVYALMLLCEDVVKDVVCLRHLRSGAWVRPVTGAQRG